MKLRKLSQRLTLRSAIAAIAMIMVLLWVWALLIDWDWLDVCIHFRAYFWPMAWGLYGILLILLIGCLFFVVRDVYISSVANKHPRVTIVARVLGALGASGAFIGFLAMPFFPIGVPMSLMAIRGVKLALARPKVAGVWMILAGIVPWIAIPLLFWVLGPLFVYRPLASLPSDDPLVEVVLSIAASPHYLIPASFFLIPGGVAALLSARKKRHQERLASMSNS